MGFLSGGFCPGGLCPGVACVQRGLCPGRSLNREFSVQGGLCPREGGLCPGIGNLCPGEGVSVQEISVWGSLSRGLCPGVCVQGGLCPGASGSLSMGSISGGLSHRDSSITVMCGWYASYWNAFLFKLSFQIGFQENSSVLLHQIIQTTGKSIPKDNQRIQQYAQYC